MSLLRVWLVLLALVCGLGIALAMLAPRGVGEELDRELDNRLERTQNEATLLLRVNARKWIDTSARIAGDAVLVESLDQATRGPADLQIVHKTVQDRLRSFNEQMKVDLVLATDARGRVIARVGVDATTYKDGIDGYPLMTDALRGLRGDDTWAIDGKLYRVAASPVILRDRYVGAIVLGQEATSELAESMKSALHTDVVILLRGRVIASTAALPILDQIPVVAGAHAEETRAGGTSALTVGGYAVVLGSFAGEASEHQALFALCAPRHPIVTLPVLLQSLRKQDPQTLPWRALVPIGAGTLVAIILGLVLVSAFGARPAQRLARDAQALARGELPRLPDGAHHGDLGVVARAVNSTIERITNRARAEARIAPAAPPPRAPAPEFPSLPPIEEPRPTVKAKVPPPISPVIALSSESETNAGPDALNEDFDGDRTSARAGWSGSAKEAPLSLFSHSLTPLPPPMVMGDSTEPVEMTPSPMERLPTLQEAKAQSGAPPLEPLPTHPHGARVFEEQTAVESPSEALLLASAQGTNDEIEADFHRVYNEFISTRQQCGETMEGVTYDKFAVKLRNNRSQLIQRYGCTNVRFQVYIKDGKTALKATPM